jgi:hypothetical protein
MGHDGDRPRLSWKEIDQRRDGSRSGASEHEPRGRVAKERAQEASQQYLKELDKIFTSERGGKEGEEFAKAVREAHGTPDLTAACEAYQAQIGLPSDPALISIFLDVTDPQLVAATLEHVIELREKSSFEVSSGLKAQLRVLAQDFNDAVAGAAEDILESL